MNVTCAHVNESLIIPWPQFKQTAMRGCSVSENISKKYIKVHPDAILETFQAAPL